MATSVCRVCSDTFEYVPRGPVPVYCGDTCRKAGYREYFQTYHANRRPREMESQCRTCGAPICRERGEMGQPKKYCDAECRQRYRAVATHGLGDGRYAALLNEQHGVCAICGSADPKGSHGRSFAIDHCHSTGVVRGLLCSPCNQALGLFSDDPERMRRAAAYVEAHRS
jgi:hypothetical protein